jgi:hypothetical protein
MFLESIKCFKIYFVLSAYLAFLGSLHLAIGEIEIGNFSKEACKGVE